MRLIQPLAYRVWDPKQPSFFYTDVAPADLNLVDRWTGLFDREGAPLYENDIIRVHYDWRLGWVRALIERHPSKPQYSARATAPDGTPIRIGFYCFSEAYRLGNFRQNPARLVRATEQFPTSQNEPWWLNSVALRTIPRSCLN